MHIQEDNIKMELRKAWCEGVDWMQVAQSTIQ